MNKRSVFSAFLGVILISGGVVWRKSVSAEASELRASVVASSEVYGCRSVCLDFKTICMNQVGGTCVVHKEICARAEPKCDLVSGK